MGVRVCLQVSHQNCVDFVFSLSLQKEKQTLSEELHALRKENKLLKENNAVMSRKREHYECEIKRLNKVPGRPGWGSPESSPV